MKNIRISDMMQMQADLYEAHKDTWSPKCPPNAREFMLFLMEEFGETIAIYKKRKQRHYDRCGSTQPFL